MGVLRIIWFWTLGIVVGGVAGHFVDRAIAGVTGKQGHAFYNARTALAIVAALLSVRTFA